MSEACHAEREYPQDGGHGKKADGLYCIRFSIGGCTRRQDPALVMSFWLSTLDFIILYAFSPKLVMVCKLSSQSSKHCDENLTKFL